MSKLPDLWQDGLAAGWQVVDASQPGADLALACDVVIVGSGAGGGMTAELLAQAGLSVVLVEEGGLHSSRDFNLRESEAYPQLYQESANRLTADKGITILQGRSVGGSTPPSTGPAVSVPRPIPWPGGAAITAWHRWTMPRCSRGSSALKPGSTSRRGKPRPMPTTPCWPPVATSWAFRTPASAAM
ncbi:choline dehydrogenase-like flavoprotein [Vogesella perlucida]|nr:choline dehydrogenase-like flavoprotein [Vogesella perlucida]